MDMNNLLRKLSAMESTQDASAGLAEASSAKDIVNLLGDLRSMAKQAEMTRQYPPGFANRLVNDLWEVITFIEANVREDVANEAATDEGNEFSGALAKAKAAHKDEFEVDGKTYKVKESEEVAESIVVQADGDEAAALVGILKLAGVAAKQPDEKMDEADRDPSYANTPDEKVREVGAAVPAGDDLHKQKGAYKAAAGGDNPMAVKAMEGKLAEMFESMAKE